MQFSNYTGGDDFRDFLMCRDACQKKYLEGTHTLYAGGVDLGNHDGGFTGLHDIPLQLLFASMLAGNCGFMRKRL